MEKNLKKFIFIKKNLKFINDEPGVYIFFDIKNHPIYIGKAKSLINRLRSYFNKNLLLKTDALVNATNFFSVIYVTSEIEAILLEAKLIKKFKPYYNISLKDDKGPSYVYITKDKYPRILISRKILKRSEYSSSFGPFHQYEKINHILISLRKIITYSTHLPTKNNCIYKQIGLCDPCPSEIENEQNQHKKNILLNKYSKNISSFRSFFNGHFNSLKNSYIKTMNYYSKHEMYEEANIVKNKLKLIDEITSKHTGIDLYIEDPYLSKKILNSEKQNLIKILKKHDIFINPSRIECYDISHIGGTNSAGSMVTFLNGKKIKKFYRHFKLNKSFNNDVSSLSEIARRRLGHLSDWGIPDLIIVDGGKGQVNVFQKYFKSINIPVIGIAKRLEKIYIPKNGEGFYGVLLRDGAYNLITRIRNEAHRFAQNYHHKLVSKSYFGNDNIRIR